MVEVGAGSDRSFLETSDNVIVEALRRVEDEIELRMVECKGAAGRVELKVALPFRSGALTNLLGGERVSLRIPASSGDGFTHLNFSIRPRQIVTCG